MKRVILLPVVILTVMFTLFVPTPPACAADSALTWRKVDLPAEGQAGGWVLAQGADIRCLTQSADGTLYCYANPSGTTYTLFKSVDCGCSWSYTGGVADVIIDIVSPQDSASVVYYATASGVYKSNDGAVTFMPLPGAPGGAGMNNVSITSLDVIRTGSYYAVAVATRDADTGEFGGVYVYNENSPAEGWRDLGIGLRDVYKIAFAPALCNNEPCLAAVTNNESGTVVSFSIGLTGDWGGVISDTSIPVGSLVSADIAFPENFAVNPDDFTVYLALNSGTGAGDAYIIYGGFSPAASLCVDLNIGQYYGIDSIDVASIAIAGSSQTGRLLAGPAASAQVYAGSEGGAGWWTRSEKPPTGRYSTEVLFAVDYSRSGRAYAATGGTESAFSVTADAGLTWNQLSLINTRITTILDVIPSPDYDTDKTLFVFTFGLGHSLWRSADGGLRWERVFSSALPDINSLELVRISPLFGAGTGVIFVTGAFQGDPVLWRSQDGGQTYDRPCLCFDRGDLEFFTVTQCAVIDNDGLLLGSYNGTQSVIYRTDVAANRPYLPKTTLGSSVIHSIAVSPDYAADETVLVGTRAGWVYYSTDGGASFGPLPGDASAAPLSGNISVAFDPNYKQNRTVYAASDTAGKGIRRFIIGESTGWENIDGTLSTDSLISSLAVSDSDILYAANSKAGDGMERSLNPALSEPGFETVVRGLDTTARLHSLKVAGDNVWAIDSANTHLLAFLDTLGTRVVLREPADGAGSIEIKNTTLSWVDVAGVTGYEWQVDTDDGFGNIADGFSGTTGSASLRLPGLEAATTYYWRVRAVTPVMGRWSVVREFTTVLGGEIDIPRLISPAVGAVVPLKPVLQWDAIAGAEYYEVLIATDYLFNELLVERAGANGLPTTAWQCDVSLAPGVTCYWKIRAAGSFSYSPWSNTGVFITEAVPFAEATPSVAITPATITTSPEVITPVTTIVVNLPPTVWTATQTTPVTEEQASPSWVIKLYYIGGAIIALILGLLITTVIMAVRMKRYD